jgi:hypothetical protein
MSNSADRALGRPGMRLVIVGLFATALGFQTVGDVATAHHITKCFGERPTQRNRSHDPSGSFLVGTPQHDVIIASQDGDHIEGRGGRDFICGLANGDDPEFLEDILGGRGSDKLNGGKGRDNLVGHSGNDLLKGGPGRDRGKGGPGRDVCVDIERRRSCEVVR